MTTIKVITHGTCTITASSRRSIEVCSPGGACQVINGFAVFERAFSQH